MSGSTLVVVMACCLTLPRCCQCRLIINNIMLHSHEINSTGGVQGINLMNELENYSSTIIATSPRGQWVNLQWRVRINTQWTGRWNGHSYVVATVKPVYNDHLMGYFSAFWSSSRWQRATSMSSRRQKLLTLLRTVLMAHQCWYHPKHNNQARME